MKDNKGKMMNGWQLYLVRPFNLFAVSLWYHWYNSSLAKSVLGSTVPDAIFVEEKRNLFRYYKKTNQLNKINITAKKILFEPKLALSFFADAFELNKKAELMLKGKLKKLDLRDLIIFFTELSLKGTVLPFRTRYLSDKELRRLDRRVLKQAVELRRVSYYPQIMEKVLIPEAIKKIRRDGFKNPAQAINVITFEELLKGDYSKVNERIVLHKTKFFLYQLSRTTRKLSLISNPDDFISKLEPVDSTDEIKGSVAYPGLVKGRVKIVNGRNIKKISFRKGSVLVSVSTSPIYLPFMKKASAIIADEGGVTSHAAILSRELKKPGIIGTKIGTGF